MPTDPMHSDSNHRTDAPVHRHHPRQAGVILVFVVVFLVLLAIIGAAFVASARIDRMQVGNLAGRAVERDPNIRDIFDQSVEAVLRGLEQDSTDVDSLDDPFMASLLPRLIPDTDATAPTTDGFITVWPKVSEPLGRLGSATSPFASDYFVMSPRAPLRNASSGAAANTWDDEDAAFGYSDGSQYLAVSSATTEWRTDATGPERKRIFPALRPFDAAGNRTGTAGDFFARGQQVFAGDSDGDGIADCGMSIVVVDDSFPEDDIRRYLRGDQIYFVGYRVVDKNAQVNVNTARSRDGVLSNVTTLDINLEAVSTAADGSIANAANTFGPTVAEPKRWGYYRSDVGLFELFSLAGLNAAVIGTGLDGEIYQALNRELYRIDKIRFGLDNGDFMTPGQISAFPLDIYNNDPAQPSLSSSSDELRGDFRYAAVGDVMERQLARRILQPGSVFEVDDWDGDNGIDDDDQIEFAGFTAGESDALSFRGGLRPKFAESDVASRLQLSVLYPDINHSEARGPIGIFPYGVQPYPELEATNANERLFDEVGGTSSIRGQGALFDPNVFPANEYDVWGGGARLFFDDPEFVTTAADAAQSPDAFSWRFNGFLVNGNFNGTDATLSINGPSDPATDAVFVRSLRPLVTTENGIVLGVTPVNIGVDADTSSPVWDPPVGFPAELVRTARMLGWTADPLVFSGSNPDVRPAAVSANVATVRQLFRGYYHYFINSGDGTRLTFGGYDLPVPAGYDGDAAVNAGTEKAMFRNPTRYPVVGQPALATNGPGLSPQQMALLRAAVTAVNVKDRRDADEDISVFVVDLGLPALDGDADGDLDDGFDATATPLSAVVYGTEKQPYITESVVWRTATPIGGGPNDFVAIELYNPYTDAIDVSDWHLAYTDRGAGTHSAPVSIVRLGDLAGGNLVLDGGSYQVVASEALDPAGNAVTNGTNTSAGAQAATGAVPATAGLLDVIDSPTRNGAEVFLLRPVEAAAGSLPTAVVLADEVIKDTRESAQRFNFNQTAVSLENYIPVDSVDMRGMVGVERRYLYQRFTETWGFVYPGRIDVADFPAAGGTAPLALIDPDDFDLTTNERTEAFVAGPMASPVTADGIPLRDVIVQNIDPANSNGLPVPGDPLFAGTEPTLGAPNSGSESLNPALNVPLQVQNFQDPAEIGTTAGAAGVTPELRVYPFGMFGRDGDVLQVPMFGAYKLIALSAVDVTAIQAEDTAAVNTLSAAIDDPANIVEWVSTTADAMSVARADPLTPTVAPGGGVVVGLPDYLGRFIPDQHWAEDYTWNGRLSDFVVADVAPGEDYFPNVRREEWGPFNAVLGTREPYDYNVEAGHVTSDGGSGGGVDEFPDDMWYVLPKPVDNDQGATLPDTLGSANDADEAFLPVQGRINPNTASAEVLSMLPLVIDPTTGRVDAVATRQMAISIANYRDGLDVGSGTLVGLQIFDTPFDLRDADDGSASPQFGDPLAALPGDRDERVALGDFTPFDPTSQAAPAGVPEFERDLNRLTRISNLITTRSDSFDVYVVVQSWGGYTSGDAQQIRLVDERRGHLRVNRSRNDFGGVELIPFEIAPKD